MSQYIHIFVRSDKDEFIPIHCTCRGSVIYDTFGGYAPYEKIAPVTEDTLSRIRDYVNNRLKEYQDGIDKHNRKIELITRMADVSIEDRVDHINDYMNTINEYKEGMKQLEMANNYISFLTDIIDEKNGSVRYDGGRDVPIIYMGIECGSNVTLDDVQE
jgi:predicted ribosome quality control (RQC) complex YloA/Tae2 family protein